MPRDKRVPDRTPGEKMIARLRAMGVPLHPNSVVRRTYAGRQQLSEGAWRWFIEPSSNTRQMVGSQWPLTELLKSRIHATLEFRSEDVQLDPYVEPNPDRPRWNTPLMEWIEGLPAGPWYHVSALTNAEAIETDGLRPGPEGVVHLSSNPEIQLVGDFTDGCQHPDTCDTYHVAVYEVDVVGLPWQDGWDPGRPHIAIPRLVPTSRLMRVHFDKTGPCLPPAATTR